MSEHFTPQGPYTLGGTFTQDNANNIETGIQAVDNAKANLTGAAFTGNISTTGNVTVGGATGGQFGYTSPAVFYNTPFSGGAALGHAFGTWDGGASVVPFSIGGRFNSARAYIDNSGNLSFGGAVSGSLAELFYSSPNNSVLLFTPQAGTTPLGIAFGTYTGSVGAIPFSIGGPFNGALSWVDNSGRFHDSAGLVTVEGTHNSVTPLKMSAGTSLPASLDANEIFFLLA